GSSIVALKASPVIGPTPGTVINRRTCASWRASFITLRSSPLTCCSTAVRASSSGLIAAIQLRAPLDQLLGSHGEDIELGTADDETEVLKKAANMVLEIALDLDQQRPAGQQRPDRVAVDILDVHLLEPTGLHDAG